MITLELLRQKRQEIMSIAARYGVSNVRVFGSVARSEASANSDVDLLVNLGPALSLISYIGFKQDLEDLLGVSVDVVDEDGLIRRIRDRVLNEAISL